MTRWLQSLQFRLSMARIDNEQKAVSALCHPGKGGQLACYCYASPLGSTHSSPSTLVLLCVSKHRIKQDPDVFYFTPGRDTRQHIAYHGLHCTLSVSLFTFLRYKPPPRIRGSRRVIADADDFLITRIGRGSFASIARVLRRSSGETRVMKRIAIDNSGLSQVLAQAEIDALEAVRGLPWFPYLMNHFSDGEDHVLTMPFYKRGDMSALIRYRGFLGDATASFYCAQLVIAIQFLHRKGFIHRDIKPENIFLDDEGHLVLADLGLSEKIAPLTSGRAGRSTFLTWDRVARGHLGDEFPFLWANATNPFSTRGISGTHWYSAPEIFRAEKYSFGVDYWSIGVIYHELVTGHIPFDTSTKYPESLRLVLDFTTRSGQLKFLADWQVEELRTKILCDLPNGRYQSISEIKQSKLFNSIDWGKMANRNVSPPHLPNPLKEDFGMLYQYQARDPDNLRRA